MAARHYDIAAPAPAGDAAVWSRIDALCSLSRMLTAGMIRLSELDCVTWDAIRDVRRAAIRERAATVAHLAACDSKKDGGARQRAEALVGHLV